MMLIWVYHGSYIPRFITDVMNYIMCIVCIMNFIITFIGFQCVVLT